MSSIALLDVFYIAVLLALSFPLGIYLNKVMAGDRVFLTRLLLPVERCVYRLMGVKADEEMPAKKYALSLLLFSLAGLIFVWLIQMLQGVLPFNPEGMSGTS